MTYHIYYNDEAIGPYEMEQMKEMIESGILTPETLAICEGSEEWKAASEIEGLFDKAPEAKTSTEEKAVPKADESKSPAPKKTSSFDVAPKKGAMPAKKSGFAPKQSKGGPAKSAAGAMPKADDNMTPEQKAAFDAAMAKKEGGGGSKKRLIIMLGVLIVVGVVAGLYFGGII